MNIGQEVRYAYNPLPDVSNADLYKEAGVRRPVPRGHPFEFSWKVGSGHDSHTFHLKPGDTLALRGKREWRVFLDTWEEQGGVLIKDPDDETEIAEKRQAALQRAYEFWRDRGQIKADDYQMRHALSDEMMERQKGSIYIYYVNEAKANAVLDAMNEPAPTPSNATSKKAAPKRAARTTPK